MTVTVLIKAESETSDLSLLIREILYQCEAECDDISVVIRINGVDQALKCSKKLTSSDGYDDCLF